MQTTMRWVVGKYGYKTSNGKYGIQKTGDQEYALLYKGRVLAKYHSIQWAKRAVVQWEQ